MTVRVEISTHNIDLSKRLEEYITKKAEKLDRHLEVLEEAKVDLTFEKTARSSTDRQIAQLTVRGKGVLLRAEERTDDIFAAFDTALERLSRQIERYKGRHYRGRGACPCSRRPSTLPITGGAGSTAQSRIHT